MQYSFNVRGVYMRVFIHVFYEIRNLRAFLEFFEYRLRYCD